MTTLWVVACVVIVGAYLAISFVLREARARRSRVDRAVTARPQLAASLMTGRPRVVLASESRCPLCRLVLACLGKRVDEFSAAPVLLTSEPAADWHDVPAGVIVVQDPESWQEISDLIPPLLMQVDANGQVTDLVLPFSEADVDAALTRWAGR